MGDIRKVLSQFHSKSKDNAHSTKESVSTLDNQPSASVIPDLFFDDILSHNKLTRTEITVLIFLYRQVWSRPNQYKSHGIGPLNSYSEMASYLHITTEELSHNLRSLENYGFIETVRSGQYFVRKYFTEALDTKYGQDYDQFF